MSSDTPTVRVGVGVFVLQPSLPENPRFLIGKRLNSHGAGTWSLPGGHLEFGETLEECAERETLEETGVRVSNPKFVTAINNIMPADHKHYVTIFMVCERVSNEAQPAVMEPNKCERWEWIHWDEYVKAIELQNKAGENEHVERRFFLPMSNLLEQRPDTLQLLNSS